MGIVFHQTMQMSGFFFFFQISHLITTITISSNVIGAFAALFFTNHSVQL